MVTTRSNEDTIIERLRTDPEFAVALYEENQSELRRMCKLLDTREARVEELETAIVDYCLDSGAHQRLQALSADIVADLRRRRGGAS